MLSPLPGATTAPLVRPATAVVPARPVGGRTRGWWPSAGAEQVVDAELAEPHEPVAALGRLVGVEVLEGGAVGQQVLIRLAWSQRRLPELVVPGGLERGLHLGVGAERGRTLL